MIELFKYEENNTTYIGIKADQSDLQNILTLPDIRLSINKHAYIIPYSQKSFNCFTDLKLSYSINTSIGATDASTSACDKTDIDVATSSPSVPSGKIDAIWDALNTKPKEIQWHGQCFRIAIDYDREETSFIKGLHKSYWHHDNKVWLAKSNTHNLEQLQSRYQYWTADQYGHIYEQIRRAESPQIIELFVSPEFPKKILIKAQGFDVDISFLKAIPGRIYLKERKIWIIPFIDISAQKITAHYTERGGKVIDRLPKNAEHYQPDVHLVSDYISYLLKQAEPKNHAFILLYSNALLRQNYSRRTLKSYLGKMLLFIQFLGDKELDEATADDGNLFLEKLMKTNASESQMNMCISAIKFYFLRVKYLPEFDIERLSRPRKSKRLPSILSKNEVHRLLQSLDNIKHLAILYTIYGGGVRLSEALSIRVSDIYWERNQILVRQGKGNKDRMVMLSSALKELLTQYFDAYQPEYWLFEGKGTTKQYSSGSVQKIVKAAAQKANITRRVTPHTLRHCFATHLMDGGVDTRFIQELLGHKDIKTTLIYTHVTNRSLQGIKSPLDIIYPDENAKNV